MVVAVLVVVAVVADAGPHSPKTQQQNARLIDDYSVPEEHQAGAASQQLAVVEGLLEALPRLQEDEFRPPPASAEILPARMRWERLEGVSATPGVVAMCQTRSTDAGCVPPSSLRALGVVAKPAVGDCRQQRAHSARPRSNSAPIGGFYHWCAK